MTFVELAPTPSLLRAMSVPLSNAPSPLSHLLFAVVAKAASTCSSASWSCLAMRADSKMATFSLIVDGVRGEDLWVEDVLICRILNKHLDQLSVEVDNGARCRETDEVHKIS